MACARRGRRDGATPCDMNWTMDMTGHNADHVAMARDDLLHSTSSVQTGSVHPIHAGTKRWMMHENHRWAIGLRAQRFVQPPQSLLAHHPVMMLRYGRIEPDKPNRIVLDCIMDKWRSDPRQIPLIGKNFEQRLASIVIARNHQHRPVQLRKDLVQNLIFLFAAMVDQVTRGDHDVGLRRQAIDMRDRLCHLRVGGNLPVTEAVSCHDVKIGYLRDDHFVWRALLSR